MRCIRVRGLGVVLKKLEECAHQMCVVMPGSSRYKVAINDYFAIHIGSSALLGI
jgi:hypothetical protein